MKYFLRQIVHLIFRTRKFNNNQIRKFAKGIRNRKILELGSGKKVRGTYPYSVKKYFDSSNEFLQSDIVKEFGHKVVDVTTMDYNQEFDVVLCMNVLEHVFDFHQAIRNIHASLKENGVAILFVPVFYPLHDEPADYWRFTEHSLRKILNDFRRVEIRHSGLREYPFAYYVEAYK